jgi:hypothetical protein
MSCSFTAASPPAAAAGRLGLDALLDASDAASFGAVSKRRDTKYMRRGTLFERNSQKQLEASMAMAPRTSGESELDEPEKEGPLLLKSDVLLCFGPPAPEKAVLCRRLVHFLGGTCLSAETLTDREVAASSPMGAKISRLREAGGLPSAAMVLKMVLNAHARLPGPFLLQDFPRTAAQLQQLEAAVRALARPNRPPVACPPRTQLHEHCPRAPVAPAACRWGVSSAASSL